ncbi:MAG: hypothetical protein JWP78_2815 [Mucilaginibacter sp.]|nr:hypothetical protein [Mucilaginibacter sp.]
MNSNFAGHWQYQYQIGGQTGAKVYPSGSSTVLILNINWTYQRLTNNNIQQQGSYKVNTVKSFFTGKNDNAIDFDSSGWKIITAQNDTLSIADNFADGYSLIYTKIK